MRHAFTLVEILIVVVVLGILAAVAVPKLVNATTESKVAATAEDLRAIETALGMYFAKNGSYPRDVGRSTEVEALEPYFKTENPFSKGAPIGGVYDYEGPPSWSPVQISIRSTRSNGHTQDDAQRLDTFIDDGDLTTGSIRKRGNRTYYLLGN